MASLVPLEPVAVGVLVAVVFFAWGWARAARYRSERGKPPWAIPPTGWGAIYVALLPVGWIIYSAARERQGSRISRSPTGLTSRSPTRPKSARSSEGSRFELPLLRPPQPASRGWHADPLHQRGFRFFDGKCWTRDVTTIPNDSGRPAATRAICVDARQPPPHHASGISTLSASATTGIRRVCWTERSARLARSWSLAPGGGLEPPTSGSKGRRSAD